MRQVSSCSFGSTARRSNTSLTADSWAPSNSGSGSCEDGFIGSPAPASHGRPGRGADPPEPAPNRRAAGGSPGSRRSSGSWQASRSRWRRVGSRRPRPAPGYRAGGPGRSCSWTSRSARGSGPASATTPRSRTSARHSDRGRRPRRRSPGTAARPWRASPLPRRAAEHARLLAWEEEMLAKVELPYRVIDVAAGDLGLSAARKYDCEAWLPTQARYLELTSTSNCTTFQARRLGIRERTEGGETRPVATVNGTLATTRWIVAILENHQQPDGSVRVPLGLRPYLGGREMLEPVIR